MAGLICFFAALSVFAGLFSEQDYDMVTGPVAAFWQQRSAMLDADQYSFHTQRGVDVLNDLVVAGSRGVEFGVEQVIV